MGWLKRGMWRAAIATTGLLLLLVLTVWVPASAGAYEGTPGLATLGAVQTAPTIDVTATMTALNEEKLRQEIQQLKNQNGNQNNWFVNNSTALIAGLTTLIVALFGIYQWSGNRRKDLHAQADDRLKTAITALGDEKESVQVGGAILLRSFLNKEDEKIYGRYYIQIFDLAVAYLRPSSTPQPLVLPDIPLQFTSLRQALIVVFKEAFPLARRQYKRSFPLDSIISNPNVSIQSLDATGIQLDNAYLIDVDLKQVWMPDASLRRAQLGNADLRGANLGRAKLKEANLIRAQLPNAALYDTDLSEAKLMEASLSHASLARADLTGANLNFADFSGANLTQAFLTYADLNKTNLEEALSLKDTNLWGVKGLTEDQSKACKAKGAIVNEALSVGPAQAAVSPPTSQSNDAQAQPVSPAQVNTPPPNTNEGSSTSAQPNIEP